jgi:hypothetical protein
MPEPTDAAATAAATPQPTPQPAPAPAAADLSHASEQDFAHPEFGPKLKSFQRGLEEKTQSLKKIESEAKETAAWNARAREAFEKISKNPTLAAQVRAALQGQPEPPEDEPEHIKSSRTAKEEALAEVRSELAMRDAMLKLGKGDYEKGKALWNERSPEINQVMEIMRNGDANGVLNLTLELLAARGNTTAPTPAAAPAPAGTAAGETGRGAPAATPATGGTSDGDIMRAMLEAVGATSPAEFAAAQGAFGRRP